MLSLWLLLSLYLHVVTAYHHPLCQLFCNEKCCFCNLFLIVCYRWFRDFVILDCESFFSFQQIILCFSTWIILFCAFRFLCFGAVWLLLLHFLPPSCNMNHFDCRVICLNRFLLKIMKFIYRFIYKHINQWTIWLTTPMTFDRKNPKRTFNAKRDEKRQDEMRWKRKAEQFRKMELPYQTLLICDMWNVKKEEENFSFYRRW